MSWEGALICEFRVQRQLQCISFSVVLWTCLPTRACTALSQCEPPFSAWPAVHTSHSPWIWVLFSSLFAAGRVQVLKLPGFTLDVLRRCLSPRLLPVFECLVFLPWFLWCSYGGIQEDLKTIPYCFYLPRKFWSWYSLPFLWYLGLSRETSGMPVNCIEKL